MTPVDEGKLHTLVSEISEEYRNCKEVDYQEPTPHELELRELESPSGLCGSFTDHLIIWTSDGFYNCPNIRHTVAHELLHSLGKAHGSHGQTLNEFESIIEKCTGEKS